MIAFICRISFIKKEPYQRLFSVKETDYNDAILRIVKEQAQLFVDDLFGKLRERMIDLRSGKTVFVGGGSILLKKHIEASGKVSLPIFVDEISANTKGYELLFKAACMG